MSYKAGPRWSQSSRTETVTWNSCTRACLLFFVCRVLEPWAPSSSSMCSAAPTSAISCCSSGSSLETADASGTEVCCSCSCIAVSGTSSSASCSAAATSKTKPPCSFSSSGNLASQRPLPDTSLFSMRLHSSIINNARRAWTGTSACENTAVPPVFRNSAASQLEIQMQRVAAKIAVRTFRSASWYVDAFSSVVAALLSSALRNPRIKGPRTLWSHCCGFAMYLVA